MRWTRKLRLRLRSLFRSRSVEQELTEELKYHLERLIDDHIAAGASPDDARYAALREMGAMEQRKEECRDERGLRLIEAIRGDLRYSVRQLRKYPVFTAAAVLTIAAGIGPNATMATIISSVFRPLPVGEADRLAVLATTISGNPRIWQRVAYPDLQDYRASETPFSDIAAWDLSPVGLTVDGRTDRLMATAVSGNYLWPGEDPLGRRFRSSSEPEGRLEVIGVVPNARYRRVEIGGPAVPRFFVSLDQFDGVARTLRVRSRMPTAGTLTSSVTEATRRLDSAVPVYDVYTLERQINDSGGGFGGVKGAAMITGVLGFLALSLALVGTYGVLSFTVRARTREIGIRMAFGLTPSRVFRMLLRESWNIALFGVAIGLALSFGAGNVMEGFLFGVVPYDPVTLLAVVILMGVISTLVGFLPARRASRMNPIETLRYE